MERLKAATARVREFWEASLIGRVVKRYGAQNASIFSKGLAYSLLFAFFTGVWSAFSVLGVVFSRNSDFRNNFLSVLDSFVPGIASGSTSVLSAESLSGISTTFTITGLVTLGMFWWQITSWMGSLRSAVQTVIDEEAEKVSDSVTEITNPVRARLIDTAAVAMVAVLFILTTVAGGTSGGLVSSVLRFFGVLNDSLFIGFIIGLAGFVAAFILNMALLLVLFRLVCQVKRTKAVVAVSLLGAFALSVIQLLGGRLLSGASSNPLLAPFAAIIAVLIWFNIIAQVLMYCSALLGELIPRDGGESEAPHRL